MMFTVVGQYSFGISECRGSGKSKIRYINSRNSSYGGAAAVHKTVEDDDACVVSKTL